VQPKLEEIDEIKEEVILKEEVLEESGDELDEFL